MIRGIVSSETGRIIRLWYIYQSPRRDVDDRGSKPKNKNWNLQLCH